jgi:hypothetical protein
VPFHDFHRQIDDGATVHLYRWRPAGSPRAVEQSRRGAGVRTLATPLRAGGLLDVVGTLYPDARRELVNEANRDEVHCDVLAFPCRAMG